MKYRKKPEHNSQNYLKVILESFEHYNTFERIDISNLLFDGYKSIKDLPNREANRKALILELISKWIQVFEDLAVLCVMFAGNVVKDDRDPFEIYANLPTKKVFDFYHKVKTGLSKKAISKIYAIKSPRELFREGIINKEELAYFKAQVDNLIKTAKENLEKPAKLYVNKKMKRYNDYGNLVKTYFNTKHGFKLIHPTQTAKKLWQFDDSDIVMVKDVVQLKGGRKTPRKVLRVGMYQKFDYTEARLLVDRIKGWTDVINEIVGAQLRYFENPNYIVSIIRKLKTDEFIKTTGAKPGRNDACPCESGVKYKKCCGS